MKVFLYILTIMAFVLGLLVLYEALSLASLAGQSFSGYLSPLRELGGGDMVDAILGDITLFIQFAGSILFVLFTAIGLLLWVLGRLVVRTTSLAERVANLEATLQGRSVLENQ